MARSLTSNALFETFDGKFLHLLISIFVVLLLYGILANVHMGRVIVELSFSLMLLLSVRAIRGKKNIVFTAIILFCLVVILRWSAEFSNRNFLLLCSNILTAINLFVIVAAILKNILTVNDVMINDVYGAICVYLLIGIIFAFIFYSSQMIDPQSFFYLRNIPSSHALALPEFIYLSFITLTSVGFGDISPVSTMAKTLTYMEAVIGQIYVIVLIARIVSLYVSNVANKRKPPPPHHQHIRHNRENPSTITTSARY